MLQLFSDYSVKKELPYLTQIVRNEINRHKSAKGTIHISKLKEKIIRSTELKEVELIWEADKIAKDIYVAPVIQTENSIARQKTRAFVRYKIEHNQQEKPDIFKYKPSTVGPAVHADIDRQYISFVIPTNHSNKNLPQHVINDTVRRRDDIFNALKENLRHLNHDIADLNRQLEEVIHEELQHMESINDTINQL